MFFFWANIVCCVLWKYCKYIIFVTMFQQHPIQLAIAVSVLPFSRMPNIFLMQNSDSSQMLEYALGMMNWPWLVCDNILRDETWKNIPFP